MIIEDLPVTVKCLKGPYSRVSEKKSLMICSCVWCPKVCWP